MLLSRPVPHSDETFESYLIRVANQNGYQQPNKFLSAFKRYLCDINSNLYDSLPTNISVFNPCHSQVSSSSRVHAIRALSHLVFKEPVKLQQLTINRANHKYSPATSALIRGNELFPRSLLREKCIPVCPKCLIENGYAHYLWHLKGYEVCHIHGVTLVSQCRCGHQIDYRTDGLFQECPSCKEHYPMVEAEEYPLSISAWLADKSSDSLPPISKSYRWGLIHWWQQQHGYFSAHQFCEYWQSWPSCFHQNLTYHIDEQFEYAVNAPESLTAAYILGPFLFNCIFLPDRDLTQNILLREIVTYLDTHLWDNGGRLANLRLNAFDVAILLGTSIDQVAALYEQRLLLPADQFLSSKPPKKTAQVFLLGDVFCLWLTDFQTETFNRATYVSRW